MKQNDLYLLKTLENLFDNSEINKYFKNERNKNEINVFVSKINKIRETNEDIFTKINKMIFELDLVSIMFKFNKINSISILNRYTEYLLDILPFVKNENIFIERVLNMKYNSSLISNIKEEENSVHLLTIHKSKGLEFDSVILLKQDIFENRSYGLNISSNGKIYNLGYKKSEIPYGFKDYKNEREEFVEKERQEQLRLYYVGLTRCKNNLITIDKK
jgi:ATP-dependent exoDNAse (exonuclease V) beta subunit